MYFKIALSKKEEQLNIPPSKKCIKKNISKFLPHKMYFQIAVTDILFISASINFVKDKTVF